MTWAGAAAVRHCDAMSVIPVFRCNDAPGVISFLVEAFGFEVAASYEGENGRIDHAELRWPGGGSVMLGSAEGREDDVFGEPRPTSVYVVCDDPDGLHDRAVVAGAEIIYPLTDEDYGSRGFSAKDPAGNIWSFGTYAGSA